MLANVQLLTKYTVCHFVQNDKTQFLLPAHCSRPEPTPVISQSDYPGNCVVDPNTFTLRIAKKHSWRIKKGGNSCNPYA